MSFNKAQKVGTVTLLALSIAACSNGHHHRTFQKPTVTPTAPNQADAKKQAEAKAKAEAERKAKEEAAKKAAEEKARQEAEAKRLAEEKAKRDAKIAELTKKATDAGLSAEQIANYANDNVDKSDADAKTALDAIVKQNRDAKIADLAKKATDAGLPQAQADNYANAQVDATDADAKTALDKLLADRQAIKDDLKQKALDAGLSDRYSQKYADDNVDTASDKTQAALNQTIKSATVAEKGTSNTTQGLDGSRTEISSATVGGYSQSCVNGYCSTSDTRQTTRRGNLNLSYNQEYSSVEGKGNFTETYYHRNGGTDNDYNLDTVTVKGLETQDAHVPTIGRAAYTGEAFSLLTGDGKFDYLVNFDERTGSGKITGFDMGTLELAEGELTKVNLDGKSVTGVSSKVATYEIMDDGVTQEKYETNSGSYTLGLYGTQAQEIAGKGSVSNGKTYQIGFGGKQNAERLAEIEAEEKRIAEEKARQEKIADLTKQATEAGLTDARIESFVNDNVKSSDKDIAAALQTAVDKLAADKAALIEQAKNVGIGDELAKQYADANVDTATDELKPALEETAKEQAKVEKAKLELYPAVDLNAYQPDADKVAYQVPSFEIIDDEDRLTKFQGWRHIYQLPYSIVVRTENSIDTRNDVDFTNGQNSRVDFDIAGLATTELGLPAEGKATYVGRAINDTGGTATLRYNLDFANRVGSGHIIGYTDSGIINLNEAGITKLSLKGKDVLGITGDAVAAKPSSWVEDVNGKYGLGFFGPEAQEIAGFVEFNSRYEDGNYLNKDKKVEFGFGGTRGEIKK